MNFFKSIILDDPDPPKPEFPHEPGPNSPLKHPHEDRDRNDVVHDGTSADPWSFGGLIKTFATRSESLIETYRRDLEEFGSGLRKETEVIREAASRAVKDGVLKSTAEIISSETPASESDGKIESESKNRSLNSGRCSWFDAQLSLIQSDLNTFCEDPEDLEEFKKWKLGFQLEEKRDEIEGLIGENGNLGGVYEKIVPSVVDRETFLCRYFYSVYKLKQQDRVRANLAKRLISVDDDDDDDELTWDVDDEDSSNGSKDEKGKSRFDVNDGDKKNVVELNEKISKDLSLDEKEVKFDEVTEVKSDERSKKCEESIERTSNENIESIGKRDVSVTSNHGAKMEEDLGWDEIEDTGSDDEKKVSTISPIVRPNRANLREKLNAEEDDEDLSWDIEDDDEPVKSRRPKG